MLLVEGVVEDNIAEVDTENDPVEDTAAGNPAAGNPAAGNPAAGSPVEAYMAEIVVGYIVEDAGTSSVRGVVEVVVEDPMERLEDTAEAAEDAYTA